MDLRTIPWFLAFTSIRRLFDTDYGGPTPYIVMAEDQ